MLLCAVTGTGRRQIGQQTQNFVAVTASLALEVCGDSVAGNFGLVNDLDHCGCYPGYLGVSLACFEGSGMWGVHDFGFQLLWGFWA